MKLALLFLAIFAVAHGAVLPNQASFGLKEDLDRFIELLPLEEIGSIAFNYLLNDAEVQDTLEYLQSEDFKNLVLDVEAIPQYKEFVKFLQENDLNIYYYIQKLHDFLDLPPFNPRSVSRQGSGVRGLLDEIEAILPEGQIKMLYYELLETSPSFQNLVQALKSDDFKEIVKNLRANPKFKQLVETAKDKGVDVEAVVALLNKIFGWDIETRMDVTFGLHEDFQDFLKLIPVENVIAILVDYLANDKQVQEVFEYVQSADFKQLVQKVDAVPEYIKFLNYLQSSGLDVYKVVNALHKLLNLNPLPVPHKFGAYRTGGVRGLLDAIEAVLPVARLKALYYEKLATSPDFKKLIEKLKSDEFKGLIERLRANPQFREIVERAKAHGVDVQALVDFLNRVFGWDIETRMAATFGLHEDFQDFLNLVPVEKVIAILVDYLANDKQVQDVFEYVQSDDFKKLVQTVDAVPEYIKFLNYLQSSGLDVYKVVNALHKFLNLNPLPVPQRFGAYSTGGVRGLLDAIEAVLPLEEFKALYYKKLETSPDFKDLVDKLKSDEFKGLIERLRANPQFREIVERAKAHGVDVQALVDFLNRVLGWDIETRMAATFGLHEDFQDFLNLVPVEKVIAILVDYLANDKQVQDVFEYVQSDDFKKLVQTVDAVPEYIKFLNYLQSSGLDVYKVVNALHKFLNLNPLPVPQRFGAYSTGGVRGLLDAIEAVLPLEEFKALYYKKLETSPDFKDLVDKLKSDEFKGLIERLRANPQFREIVERAKAHGVDVQALVDFLNRVLGWDIETRMAATFGLHEDFQDFLNLVPVEKVIAILVDYLANDKQVQDVFEYVQSDDFKKLVQTVDAVPEYIKFLNYLQSSGLDVYKVVNALHKFLNLNPLPVPQRFGAYSTEGVRGLLDAIEAVLPLEEFKALYYKKLETSPDFKDLVDKLKSDEFKGLIERLRANPIFRDIVERAKAHGIDVQALVDFLNRVLGWGIETRNIF